MGSDGRCDPARIGAVLRELDADVVGLQEVDGKPAPGEPAGGLDIEWLPDLGHRAVSGATVELHDRHYGNVLLTRLPIRAVRRLDLSFRRREPRGALDVDLETDSGQTVRVVVTHLGLSPGERRHQVRGILGALAAAETSDLVILLGDINEWFLIGRPLRWLHSRFGWVPALRTFPTRPFPLLALDRIWVQPRSALVRLAVHDTPAARRASDHLPVKATIATAPGAPG